jgi:hypothetical protein
MTSAVARRLGMALALGAVLPGCDLSAGGGRDPVSGWREPVFNMVTTASTPETFSFAVQARDFTFEQSYASPTRGDSLAVSLAVVSYGGGTALLEIRDSAGGALLQQTVEQNIAAAQTTVHGTPPYAVHVRFTGFGGLFALAVGAPAP